MSLTMRRGPFGGTPAGAANFTRNGPAHVLYLDPSAKRIRAVFNGETVIDSRRAQLMHETGLLPVWYFPEQDVRKDLLVPTERTSHCPFKGDASYWTVTVGDRTADNAVWSYLKPIDSAPPIGGLMAFYYDTMDTWLEEDEEVIGHPRDPYHRIDICRTSDPVEVRVGGHVVAESTRTRALFETGLPTRYYFPVDDIRVDLLEPSTKTTICPYKGHASYWSVVVAGERWESVAWSYLDPFNEVLAVAGYRSFLGDAVEINAAGEAIEAVWPPR
jgi:uncharacterized protein (DUF427 family)